jgi:hypothetical protein
VKVWEFRRENSLLHTSLSSPSIAAESEHCPFHGRNQTHASWLGYRVHSVFCVFIVDKNIVVSFHHTMAMKHRLEDDETERQLKCKKCDVGMCILGASRSTIKGKIRSDGGEEPIYRVYYTKEWCGLKS